MADKESGARLHVRVTPGAPRNEVMSYVEGVLKVKVAAPPVKGQANKELISFLADILGVRKNQISILKGETSRDKVLAIEGVTEQELKSRLTAQGRLV
ncbi:MAG: protein of unknown function DUF167 [Dehalococcoidia bacterium]|nr:protein of unknown function DUF167 [Dehalococcoidia bacterium]